MACALRLKQQLNNLKKSSSKVSEYVLDIKNIGAELKSIEQVVIDSYLIQTTINGFGHEFHLLVVLISSQLRTMSLQDAQYLFMLLEQRIKILNQVFQIYSSNSLAIFVENVEKKVSLGNFILLKIFMVISFK
ncbi:hypothetical protein Syun_020766 [Stephania yunnanensis]|uniref:Uncharacterized protein n=1 Tax=Stephania yunnanensis TaxID=152371 RepID=A0AAP0IED7_9MAGN